MFRKVLFFLSTTTVLSIAGSSHAAELEARGTVVVDDPNYQVRCTDASFCGKDAPRADKARGEQEAKAILKSTKAVDEWMTSLGFENPRFMDQTGDGKRQLYITADTGNPETDGCGGGTALACATAQQDINLNTAYEIRYPENYTTLTDVEKDVTVAHEFTHTYVRRRAGTYGREGVLWLEEAIAEASATAWGAKQGHFKSDRFATAEDMALDLPFHQSPDGSDSYSYAKSRYLIRVGKEIGSQDNFAYLRDFKTLTDDGSRGMNYLYSEKLPANVRFNTMYPRFVAELNETENVDSNGVRTEHFTDVPELRPKDVTFKGTNELASGFFVEPFSTQPLMFQELVAKDAPPDALMYMEVELAPDRGGNNDDIHLVYDDQIVKSKKLQRAIAPNAGQMIGFVRLVNAPTTPDGRATHEVRVATTYRRMDFEWPECVEAGKPFSVRTPSPVDLRQMKNLDFIVGGEPESSIRQSKEISLKAPSKTGEQDMAVNVRPPSKHGGAAKKITLGKINVQKMCEPKIGEWCEKLMNWNGDRAAEAGATDELFGKYDVPNDIRTLDGMNRMLMDLGMPAMSGANILEMEPACRLAYITVSTMERTGALSE